MAKSLIPLIDIADDACEFAGDTTRKHRRFIAKQAAKAWKEINMYVNKEVSVTSKRFIYGRIIEMDSDFVYETKVGVYRNGRVVYLGRNMELGLPDAFLPISCNQTEAIEYINRNLCCDDFPSVPFYGPNGEIILSYGCGVETQGLYSVDRKNGRIYIGSNFPADCEIIVEYVTDGISSGIKMIPSETEETIYNYCLWQYYLKKGDGRYREFERYYEEQRFKLKSLYQFEPIDYIVNLFRMERGSVNNLL